MIYIVNNLVLMALPAGIALLMMCVEVRNFTFYEVRL